MDIRYLESLVSVVEHGSIAGAARAQYLTPAAVGQRIAILEEHFKVALLDRNSHRAVPSLACLELLPRVRRIVSDFHDLGAGIANSGLTGEFRVGVVPTMLAGVMPGTVREMKAIAPDLHIKIQPGTSESLYSELNGNNLDGAIIALPHYDLPKRIVVDLLRVEPLLLISSNPEGKTPREILEKNPYIRFDSSSWGGIRAHQYLKDKKIHVNPVYELDVLEVIEKLVLEQMGVSLVPRWTGLDLKQLGLESLVVGENRYGRKVALVTLEDSSRKEVIQAFRESLQKSLREKNGRAEKGESSLDI